MTHQYEVTLTLGQLSVEHVGEALRRLREVDLSFVREGLSVDASWSVERDRDGIERWSDWIDDEGEIKDIQPWEESDATHR